jgi:hypothetical protein
MTANPVVASVPAGRTEQEEEVKLSNPFQVRPVTDPEFGAFKSSVHMLERKGTMKDEAKVHEIRGQDMVAMVDVKEYSKKLKEDTKKYF